MILIFPFIATYIVTSMVVKDLKINFLLFMLIFVIHDSDIISLKKVFPHFYGVENIESFYSNYEQVCKTFIDDDGYLQCA